MRCTSTTMLLLACRVARVERCRRHERSSAGCARWPRPSPSPGPRSPSLYCQRFLGTGKTTLFRNLLEEASQDKDSKVGVVVNDMAAVNIDAKITARRLDLDETDGPKMQGAAEFVEIGGGGVCAAPWPTSCLRRSLNSRPCRP